MFHILGASNGGDQTNGSTVPQTINRQGSPKLATPLERILNNRSGVLVQVRGGKKNFQIVPLILRINMNLISKLKSLHKNMQDKLMYKQSIKIMPYILQYLWTKKNPIVF